MAGEILVPHGLKPSRGIRTIWKLAATQNKQGRRKQYRLYVIEVTESETVNFYVGHTRRNVENERPTTYPRNRGHRWPRPLRDRFSRSHRRPVPLEQPTRAGRERWWIHPGCRSHLATSPRAR